MTIPQAPIIFVTDGTRTILNEPWMCEGCGTMHYFFINTTEGHRCPGCANRAKFETQASVAAEVVKRGFDVGPRFTQKN